MKFTADRYKIMNTVRNNLNYLCVLMGCELALTSGLGWRHYPAADRKEKCCKPGGRVSPEQKYFFSATPAMSRANV